MIKNLILVTLCCIAINPSSIMADNKGGFSFFSKSKSKVVATYDDGKEITSEEVKLFAKHLLDHPNSKVKKFEDLDEVHKKEIIKGIAINKALAQKAKEKKILDDPSFIMQNNAIKHQLYLQFLAKNHLEKNPVTKKMIDDKYNEIKKTQDGKPIADIAHIIVKDEATAKKIKKQLRNGADFNSLVQKHSIDHGSKANNGVIKNVMRGMMVPKFDSVAFSLNKGQISEPTQTEYGWHIIKLIDKRKVKVPAKEKIATNIEMQLSKEIANKYLKDIQDATINSIKYK